MNIKHAVSYLLKNGYNCIEMQYINRLVLVDNKPAFREDPDFQLTKDDVDSHMFEQDEWVRFINENSRNTMPLPYPGRDPISLSVVDVARVFIFHNWAHMDSLIQCLNFDVWQFAERYRDNPSVVQEFKGHIIF